MLMLQSSSQYSKRYARKHLVQPKDGGPLQTYAIQFLEEAPKIDHLSLQVEQADGLKEDQTVKLSVLAHYQDGTQAVLPAE